MIASGIVLGLVLRLFLQAHVSAGEEAALGPTPAHPSACEDSEIARTPRFRVLRRTAPGACFSRSGKDPWAGTGFYGTGLDCRCLLGRNSGPSASSTPFQRPYDAFRGAARELGLSQEGRPRCAQTEALRVFKELRGNSKGRGRS